MRVKVWAASISLGCWVAHGGPASVLTAAFEERSPFIDRIEIKKGTPFLEVFIHGRASLKCVERREYVVDRQGAITWIVPRFRSSRSLNVCSAPEENFKDKAADLDPKAHSSQEIRVLGFLGWHKIKLETVTTLDSSLGAKAVGPVPQR